MGKVPLVRVQGRGSESVEGHHQHDAEYCTSWAFHGAGHRADSTGAWQPCPSIGIGAPSKTGGAGSPCAGLSLSSG